MKYNFILAIDETSKDEINELVNILADNKIKFHVLKSDNELIESKKYKEVIDKAINWTKEYIKQWDSEDDVISDMKILLNILKEVE